MNSSCVKTNERLKVHAVISNGDYKLIQMFTYYFIQLKVARGLAMYCNF